ncbi:BIR protein [Plasmodium berghei]|uniref:BIR protein n=3 Tax=Plasmodium berghei TaxID=5821 RepID=A0A509APA8_PLABA|nr:BIR protein [Plasmodium berghei ANKA]CXI87153.1 BIR protein [Plasmodium berghei]SBW38275.1 BIR protein [Plasmodium berghei]SCL83196.1 BIR protein [Plasmodium berghei]VUC57385.1 BIR protein [Plasmodium berghei ANKA]|eukprot:XP_034423156.1 BIR protein [Plasmodium berghei ANKA]
MDANICSNFLLVRNWFPDNLIDGQYKIVDDQHLKKYCSGNSCDSDLEKINAGCLYLFNEFFGSSEYFESVAKSNTHIVEYIMIWLSYMLNLKENNDNQISALQHFYTTYINKQERYTNTITDVTEYNSYKDLIDKTNMVNMDIKDISKFYSAFKLLCEMYTGFDTNTSNCTCSEKANKFVEEYKELNNNNNKGSSYNKILSTLSTEYNKLKNECKDAQGSNFPPLSEINTSKISVKSFEETSAQTSVATSSNSSIGNKLFTVLSIFGAIAFFLGISYKYSLFGFRKRPPKQHLRGKLKK